MVSKDAFSENLEKKVMFYAIKWLLKSLILQNINYFKYF